MSGRKYFSLALCAAAAVGLACAVITAQPAPPPVETLGNYIVRVGGYYTGTGNANVGATSVTLTADVTDEAGQGGRMTIPAIPLRDGRFRGEGTIMGQSIAISGRIDAPDGQVVRRARLSANFAPVGEGYHGRVVGDRREAGSPVEPPGP